MLLGPHILVGAAVASQFSSPVWGLVFAFLVHFALDRIPHWEYSIESLKQFKTRGIRFYIPILKRVFLDIAGGFTILAIAINISHNDIPFWAWAVGGLFGILPDGLTALLFAKRGGSGIFYNFLKLFFLFHQRIHYSKEGGLPPLRIGLGTQAIAALLALYFIIF